jgi:lipoprotein-anchoring transpeptidase ErfK/SrfK
VAGPDERWLDIDLSQQTLVAYEGDTPVFATLISSGRPGHKTPTGVYRIERKVAERTMNSMADSDDLYSVDKVPWTAYFDTGYALHAAFWHSGFGTRRSHGCINLSPSDAQRLYAYTAPGVAPGWAEIYGHAEQPGSVLQIRSRQDPEPQTRGYAKTLTTTSTALARR